MNVIVGDAHARRRRPVLTADSVERTLADAIKQMRKETRRGTSARGTNDRMQFSNYSFSSNTARYRRDIFRREPETRRPDAYLSRDRNPSAVVRTLRLRRRRNLLFFSSAFYWRDYAGYSFGEVISSVKRTVGVARRDYARGEPIDGFDYGTRWYPASEVGHLVFYQLDSRAVYSLK